jgi:homoserine kinase
VTSLPVRTVSVRVPATTANLGPGFDCLGLALDLWNDASFSLEGERLSLLLEGEDSGALPSDERNMVIRAVRFFCEERGLPIPRGLKVICRNRIPLGSGLGSSAAAVLLGLLGASELLYQPLNSSEALEMAAQMEGHADNAAAALLGGLTIVASAESGWLVRRIEPPQLQAAYVLPAVDLPTRTARAALPPQVPLKDAAFNLARSALVIEALRDGDMHLLGQAMEDRLHQPFRFPLVPGAEAACSAARKAGAAAVALSGAGPSLIAFTDGDPAPIAAAMQAAFDAAGVTSRSFTLKTTSCGASVTTASP